MTRLLPFLLLVAVPAFASGGGEHGDAHGHGGIPWATLTFSTINLLIFGYILNRFAVPGGRAWVAGRRDAVVRELEEAATLRGEAQRLKSEWEARVAKLDEEIATLRAEARAEIERDRERVLAAARAAADKLKRDAERIALAEARQLESQLRGDVAHKAVALAEQRLRAGWSAEDQDGSIAEFLRRVQA